MSTIFVRPPNPKNSPTLVCVKCAEEQPRRSFDRQIDSRTGRQAECKACKPSYYGMNKRWYG